MRIDIDKRTLEDFQREIGEVPGARRCCIRLNVDEMVTASYKPVSDDQINEKVVDMIKEAAKGDYALITKISREVVYGELEIRAYFITIPGGKNDD